MAEQNMKQKMAEQSPTIVKWLPANGTCSTPLVAILCVLKDSLTIGAQHAS